MQFEWDPEKAEANQRKHGVSFGDATELLTSGVPCLEDVDQTHSLYEIRFITIGPIASGVIVVIWTERDEDTIRIISARFATRVEIERYQQSLGGSHEP